ncbi:hypothetical protein [Streptococcus pneumoniae]|nr:hypothetical protein [Streptococcus pneumoniae]
MSKALVASSKITILGLFINARVKKMKKENEYVILTTASLGVMIGIVFAIFLDFPVEYGISLGLLNGIVLGSLIVYKNNKN